jgi:phage major head subunit gpT-like protein
MEGAAMPISSRQLSLLQVGRRHLALSDDQWRALLIRITPNVLVVPAALETQARKVLTTQNTDGGASNPWQSTAQLIVCPYLDV